MGQSDIPELPDHLPGIFAGSIHQAENTQIPVSATHDHSCFPFTFQMFDPLSQIVRQGFTADMIKQPSVSNMIDRSIHPRLYATARNRCQILCSGDIYFISPLFASTNHCSSQWMTA